MDYITEIIPIIGMNINERILEYNWKSLINARLRKKETSIIFITNKTITLLMFFFI